MSFYAGFSGKEEIVLKHLVLKQVTTFAITKCQLLKLNIKQYLPRRRRKFSIIYNKPTRCNSGSIVFINKYKYALHGIVQCTTDLEHLYRIYSNPTHDKHQWLLLEFIVLLMMDAKGVRNM